MKLQIQSACCALITELAFNETNSYEIVNSNGVYLVSSKLLITLKTEVNCDRNRVELEKLNCNIWHSLRILFSAERHRSLIKKLIPFSILTQFVFQIRQSKKEGLKSVKRFFRFHRLYQNHISIGSPRGVQIYHSC